MSAQMRPPVVLRAEPVHGVWTWVMETQMTLYREGQTNRMQPTTFRVNLLVERVGLDQNPRGLSVNQFFLRPADT